jgi:FkbM family methyltransferase
MTNPLHFLNVGAPINVMDVGASAINEVPLYKSLLDCGYAHLYAFDGDARQTAEIHQRYGGKASVFADFLFDGSERTLYLAAAETGMTSLLKPRAEALAFFNGFTDFGRVEATHQVRTRRLDDIEGLPDIDLIKLDVQGAELTILKHGPEKLRNCLAIHLEVSYVCLYEGQPAFGDIDIWMRSQGFMPHRFLEVKQWVIAPTIFGGNPRIPGNQLLESDIIYIRDPLRITEFTDTQLLKMAVLAHFFCDSRDLCVYMLLELERRNRIDPLSHQVYLTLTNPPASHAP